MNRLVLCIVSVFPLLSGPLATGPRVIAADQPISQFTGVPRDIDYLKNQGWTQVILQGKDPNSELVSMTKNDRIQSILLVAFSLKSEVTVDYFQSKPIPTLKAVKLSVKALPEKGRVSELKLDEKDNYCRATIYHDMKFVGVWTRDARMQSILETALRQSIPVQELMFDEKTNEITRGKVNEDLRKKRE